MKKIIAIVLTLVMALSVAVVPVYAIDQPEAVDKAEEIVEDIKSGDLYGAVENVYDLIVEIIDAIHSLVGSIMGMAQQECPFCGELHTFAADEEAVPEAPEVVVFA